ncbi:uncharacterized protein LOC129569226 [Sitodiplosis mosellana]|uniref:uncharacterized protein LOC129569226 n=1 Tax=Sitodiplosis mosellana TaxID=263140 RepID=UPI002444EA2B|nr:uncharacterized protein LOC129569226 [Sitodiplosis mosellana]XP_055303856.1 uncharacterized protein LOC129569226 [Sitodiplosis mosellana]
MSKDSSHSSLRKRPVRKAKEKATFEIRKYFKPKSLQIVPEDAEILNTKQPMKDKNNNSGTKTKRNFNQLYQKQSKHDEKESISEAHPKRAKPNSWKPESDGTKLTLKKIASKQLEFSSKSHRSKDSSTSSLSELVNVLDSPVVSKSVIVLDSSIASNESEYGFDALQTDDPTDEEIDVELTDTKKPYWSLYNNRIAIVIDQTKVRTKVIDKLFDSGPETVNSLEIFPMNTPISRRRSTAVWNTPPRYSMLPKY